MILVYHPILFEYPASINSLAFNATWRSIEIQFSVKKPWIDCARIKSLDDMMRLASPLSKQPLASMQ
jgi:hypothetical protein